MTRRRFNPASNARTESVEITIEPGEFTPAQDMMASPVAVFVWTVYRRQGQALTAVMRGIEGTSSDAARRASRLATDYAIDGSVAEGAVARG